MMRRMISAAVVVGSLLAATVHTPATALGSFTPKSGPLLNVPRNAGGTEAQQRVWANWAIQTMDAMAPGSVLRIATFDINDPDMLNAIHRAKARGVHVRLILDGTAVNDAEKKLVATLGTNINSGKSWARVCAESCSSSLESIMHNKIFLASSVGSPRRVLKISAVGSANFTKTNNYLNWNTTQVMTDPNMYDGLARFFEQLRYDKTTKYTVVKGSGLVAYLWPSSTAANPMLDAIKATDCSKPAAKGYGNAKRQTVIRVQNFHITDARRAESRLLAAKKKAGCDVAVEVVNNRYMGTLGQGFADDLWYGKVPLYDTYRDLNGDGAYDLYTHNKGMLINGRVYGSAGNKLTWTGSANWTGSALRIGNEAALRIDHNPTYDAYNAQWERVRTLATRVTTRPITTRPPMSKTARQAPDAGQPTVVDDEFKYLDQQ